MLVLTKARADMSLVLRLVVLGGVLSCAVHDRGVTAVAVGAAQAHCAGRVHGGAVDRTMAARTHAATRLSVGFFLRLEDEKLRSPPLRALGNVLGLVRR